MTELAELATPAGWAYDANLPLAWREAALGALSNPPATVWVR